jgi:YHS domain-containing protein
MKRRSLIINGVLATAGIAIPILGQVKRSDPLPKAVPPPRSTFIPKSAPQRRPEKVRDPVCGLMVEKDPELSAVYQGQTYYFCSRADRDKFKKSPEKYVKGKRR